MLASWSTTAPLPHLARCGHTGGADWSLVNGSISSEKSKKKKTDTKGWHTWRDKLMSTSPLPSHVCFVHQFRGEIIAADMIKIKNSPQKRFPMLPAAARLTNHVSYRGLRKRDGSHWVPPGWMSLRHTAEHWWTLISSNSHTAVEACKSVGAATREKHKIPCKEELGTKYCKCF